MVLLPRIAEKIANSISKVALHQNIFQNKISFVSFSSIGKEDERKVSGATSGSRRPLRGIHDQDGVLYPKLGL